MLCTLLLNSLPSYRLYRTYILLARLYFDNSNLATRYGTILCDSSLCALGICLSTLSIQKNRRSFLVSKIRFYTNAGLSADTMNLALHVLSELNILELL